MVARARRRARRPRSVRPSLIRSQRQAGQFRDRPRGGGARQRRRRRDGRAQRRDVRRVRRRLSIWSTSAARARAGGSESSSWRRWPRETGGACTSPPSADQEHGGARRCGRSDIARWRASPPKRTMVFDVQAYGMTSCADLFTNRQLPALTTFSDLVARRRGAGARDALARGRAAGDRLTTAAPAPRPTPTPWRRILGLPSSRLRRPSQSSSATLGQQSADGDRQGPVRATGDPDGLGLRRGEPVCGASAGNVRSTYVE